MSWHTKEAANFREHTSKRDACSKVAAKARLNLAFTATKSAYEAGKKVAVLKIELHQENIMITHV